MIDFSNWNLDWISISAVFQVKTSVRFNENVFSEWWVSVLVPRKNNFKKLDGWHISTISETWKHSLELLMSRKGQLKRQIHALDQWPPRDDVSEAEEEILIVFRINELSGVAVNKSWMVTSFHLEIWTFRNTEDYLARRGLVSSIANLQSWRLSEIGVS